MLSREQIVTLADELEASLKKLKRRLSSERCSPPAPIVARVVTTLSGVNSKLVKLDQDVARAQPE